MRKGKIMQTWAQFLAEQEKKEHSFSSTQINLPDGLAEKVIEYGKKHIPDEEIFEKGDDMGREDEIHVTVLYGLHADTPKEVKKVLEKESTFPIQLGKISIFDTHPDFDVVKIDVDSPGLVELNKKLRDNCEHTMTHPKYVPHITIAYLKKGKAKKYKGDDYFAEMGFLSNEVLFSSKNREKTKILLKT